MKKALLSVLLVFFFFAVFPQQVVTISINQPGVINCVATNVDQSIQKYSFKVYPNPANEKITIELNQSPVNKKYNIRLLNLVGQTLFLLDEPSVNGILKKEFDISEITNGIYFLKINSSEFKSSEKILVSGKK